MRKLIYDSYKKVSELVLPPHTTSSFKRDGRLTGDEFVAAGDFLVRACPTWVWEGGDEAKQWPFLPKGKQYLITRNVPCLQRASTVEAYAEILENSTVEEDVEGGEWVATSTDQEEDAFEVLPTRSGGNVSADIPDVMDLGREDLEEEGSDDESSIPDVSSLTEQLQQQTRDPTSGGVKEESSIAKCTMKEEPPLQNSHILLTRTYDILISYDKHHAVPRVWLIGYGEDGVMLPKEKVLEDIISDYRLRTVTMEPHPHHVQGGRIVSIHPCKHADVMKKFASMVVSSSSEGLDDEAKQPCESEQSKQRREFPTEHYMILFLKFMSSVIPTIEYDFTLPAGL